jgi:rhamnosyltransferase
MNTSLQSISAVIVTYNPERSLLSALINAVLPQVGYIVVVDNGSSSESIELIRSAIGSHPIGLILLGENLGIAAAQNRGISRARDLGSKYVILFDHDSRPSDNMVDILVAAMEKKEQAGIKVATVGPQYFDRRQKTHSSPFIEIKNFQVRHQPCTEGGIVAVSFVISSGSIISIETFSKVGGMLDDLFIDYVDVEWCLRARQLGYQSFGVCDAVMEHDLGDSRISFMGKSIPLHSPLRHYYLFRNAVWLYRKDYLPLQWKVSDAYRLLMKYGFYSLCGKPRLAHIKMMTKGIWHGLTGQLGQFK